MIVRELLAVFGLKYDAAGERAARKGISGLQSQVDNLTMAMGQVFTAGLIAAPFVGLAKMASDAQESLNLLGVVFTDSAQDVVEWSNAAGAAMGRSRYAMRELAAELGGLVGAMVGPGEQAAKMSMQLAELVVDLESLRNISQKEALLALQSALAGETEAIKRFGVDLTVAAQEAEALRMGLGKTYKQLTKQEKAQVRYNILVRDLAFVQGDAAKTLDDFANSWRAMKNIFKDIGTELGFFLLPAFEGIMKSVRDGAAPLQSMARRFREWAADTNLAKGALLGVGTIIGALLLPLFVKMLPLMLAFAAFALIMDDVVTTFEGGESVLGKITEWLDALDKGLPGVGSKILKYLFKPLNMLRDVLGAVGVLAVAAMDSISSGSITPLKHAASAIGESAFQGAKSFFMGGGEAVVQGYKQLESSAASAAGTVIQGARNFAIEIQQQAGQSAEEVAQVVTRAIDARLDERDRDIANELLPQGAD